MMAGRFASRIRNKSIGPRDQRGVAVIVAILIVALATILSVRIFWQQRAWGDLIFADSRHQQIKSYARGGLLWARTILRDDASRSSVDHLQEIWATRLPMTPINDEFQLGGELIEQQGLFNLNNLIDSNGKSQPRMIQVYQSLLGQLGLSQSLAMSLADWMDADSTGGADGKSEDESYLEARPPRLPANSMLREIEDLSFVQGYTPEIIHRLRPYVTVLPRQTKINVNTAPAEILLAYINGLKPEEAKFLIDTRNVYFRDQVDFLERLPRKGEISLDRYEFDVSSQYFWLHIKVQHAEAVIESNTLLERYAANPPTVIWEKFE